jgi:hypothetical protein
MHKFYFTIIIVTLLIAIEYAHTHTNHEIYKRRMMRSIQEIERRGIVKRQDPNFDFARFYEPGRNCTNGTTILSELINGTGYNKHKLPGD